MKRFRDEWIDEWCRENGWTDLFIERCCNYWAFPPSSVMPLPIPNKILREIKAAKGMSDDEKLWSLAAVAISCLASICCFILKNPLPITCAFGVVAFIVGQLEIEEF
ncbi:hypothetical protein H6F44_03655 [Pseudanabaena sp. FACHB-1277]|jgi:hypothetical protein|uniref:Uncharacterized protein n=1 Tax=Pseudanabaena cinerea FACHB-1277 TaxID=2949581 RepID=A0A926Z544_9CYAN|nr:hypothetical protein [Pseudanabaena cinerea]MBD2149223.1 hypothetical protein [Pseudanabaena cinerea FACHB-1277]